MAFQILLLFPRTLAYCSLRLRDLMVDYQSYRNTDLKNSESMDAEQRYTEEAKFDFDEQAFSKILKLRSMGYYLSMSIQAGIEKVPVSDGIIQTYAVITGAPPNINRPFEIQVLRQTGDIPVVFDFKRIDMDTYLEMIIKNKSITHERVNEIDTAISTETDRHRIGNERGGHN
jgi:hypothetical protein